MFDSFGFEGFKEFVIQDDQTIINKIFYGVEKFDKKDNKITLVTLRFSIVEYRKLDNFYKLSKTTDDLTHMINEVLIHLVNDQLQMIEKDTCEIYQIYFYVNLFNSLENSSMLREKTLNRKTIEKLLNEILLMDKEENEDIIEIFAQENNIKRN